MTLKWAKEMAEYPVSESGVSRLFDTVGWGQPLCLQLDHFTTV